MGIFIEFILDKYISMFVTMNILQPPTAFIVTINLVGNLCSSAI